MFRSGLRWIISQRFPQADIAEASSCPECLQLVRGSNWDLILLDISMQSQNSLAILPDICKLQPRSAVLMLSMHSDTQFVVQSLKAGASGYLTKEHTAEELIRAIDAITSGRRYISPSIAENLAEYLSLGGTELPHQVLSAREREVFMLIAAGKSVAEIAGLLMLSAKTVSTYRTRILEKMSMGSNAELMRYALRNQLVT